MAEVLSVLAKTERDDGSLTVLEWQQCLCQVPSEVRNRVCEVIEHDSDVDAWLRERWWKLDDVLEQEVWDSAAEADSDALPERILDGTMIRDEWRRSHFAGREALIESFTSRMQYLGPLRDEPRALYSRNFPSAQSEVGLRGEATATVLRMKARTGVRHVPPEAFERMKARLRVPTQLGKKITITNNTVGASLCEAVNQWLSYLGIAEEMRPEDYGRYGLSLAIWDDTSNSSYDLTNVGVGVSQVLPILVMGLLAPEGATLLFEQPELHLHPRVQTRLADFFLSLVFSGRQCIIETHSEHIINRLRLRVAADTDDEILKKLKIHFVEKKNGCSHFREVEMNEFGAISDWPDGFFDESQQAAEDILRAAMAKHRERGGDTGQ